MGYVVLGGLVVFYGMIFHGVVLQSVRTPPALAGEAIRKGFLRRLASKAKAAGATKVTVIAVGGALAVVIPGELTEAEALRVHAQVEAVAREAASEAGLEYRGPLSSEGLSELTAQGPTVVPIERTEQVTDALAEAGYDVTYTDDLQVIDAAYGPGPLEGRDAEPGDPPAFGFRGVVLAVEEAE